METILFDGKIDTINMVGIQYTNVNTKNKSCHICHNLLEESSIYSDNSLNTYVMIGKCNHAFHKECINRWHQDSRQNKTCPVCCEKWEII